jgi:hypothetical protein
MTDESKNKAEKPRKKGCARGDSIEADEPHAQGERGRPNPLYTRASRTRRHDMMADEADNRAGKPKRRTSKISLAKKTAKKGAK